MQCKGIVQGNIVILEEGVHLPDGVRVSVTMEQEEEQEPAEVTPEELAQRRALGERMKAFGQRLAGRQVNLVESSMSAIDHPALYDDLLDLLAASADVQRVLAFRLSHEKQSRLDALLEKNREGTLTTEEEAELDAYERFEHLVRLLKARLLQKQDTLRRDAASV